jgi:hypothetical protein
VINPEWIIWSKSDFELGLALDEVSSIIYITRKKEVWVIYKPTLISNDRNDFISIIGKMFDKSSSPAFSKLARTKSACAMPSVIITWSPPSFIPKSPSNLIQ